MVTNGLKGVKPPGGFSISWGEKVRAGATRREKARLIQGRGKDYVGNLDWRGDSSD